MLFKINFLFILFISINTFASECPIGTHWDEEMKMCMPDETPVQCPDGSHWSVEEGQCVPNNCKENEHWDNTMKMCMKNNTQPSTCGVDQHWDSSMGMCMPDLKTNSQLNFHVNQFLIGINESGPRGRSAFSAPNMFMLSFEQRISKCDSVKVSWMGTTDKWTVPAGGTPELLQTGEANKEGTPYIDAQHPHSSPIMGLTFAEVHCFGKEGVNKFTLSFSPRGEGSAGPLAFMHRPSAAGNPNAPLGHHLQDVFHILSTVLSAKIEMGKWTIEGSIFSGKEPSPTEVNLDMHRFDSGGVRINRKLNDQFTIGGSYANVLETHRAPVGNPIEGPVRNNLFNAWVYSNHKLNNTSTLSTSTIFGQSGEEGKKLNSFLEELSYKFGDLERDHVFSRLEVLQRTPEQLEINVTGDSKHPEWVKAFTIGYERNLNKKQNGNGVFLGGSVTESFVPDNFKLTYGNNPLSAELHLRVVFIKNKSFGKR